MTDDGSQPPIEQLATAVHRGSVTRSWCGPLLLVCAAGRGCSVVGVLCMSSDVSIYAVSFQEKHTQNIRNINTVEVLIFNPNDVYISVHSKRGSVTQQQQTGIRCGLRTADSDEHNYRSYSSTAQMGVSHARCCLLMLMMGGSVVTSCSLHVLLYTRGVCPGLCAR